VGAIVTALALHINDPQFADACVDALLACGAASPKRAGVNRARGYDLA
jgi:hypothetical protein